MSNLRSASGRSIESVDAQIIERAGRGIQHLLERRENVSQTFGNLYARHVSGESVQPAINTLLSDIDDGEAFWTFRLANDFSIEALAQQCVDEDIISESIREEILDLWGEISWAEPAGEAFAQANRGTYYWSDQQFGMAGITNNGRIQVESRALHGVDELWEVEPPLTELILRNIVEISGSAELLKDLPEQFDVTEEEIDQLETLVDQLQDTAEDLSSAIEGVADTGDDTNGDEYDQFV